MVDQLKIFKAKITRHPHGEKLLSEAFTHRSYAAENRLDYDNQRLEFLGDAVLELVLSEWLFKQYPEADEGEMTKLRSAFAREETLAEFARQLDLGAELKIGHGEQDADGDKRNSTLADLFEAFLGTVYLACGYDEAANLVAKMIASSYPDPRKLLHDNNPKGALQELTQGRWGSTPRYRTLSVTGPSHQPHYQVEVSIRNLTAAGSGSSRKEAEAAAARRLYEYLRNRQPKD